MNHLLKIRAAAISLAASTATGFSAGHMGIVFETGGSDVFFPFGKIQQADEISSLGICVSLT